MQRGLGAPGNSAAAGVACLSVHLQSVQTLHLDFSLAMASPREASSALAVCFIAALSQTLDSF